MENLPVVSDTLNSSLEGFLDILGPDDLRTVENNLTTMADCPFGSLLFREVFNGVDHGLPN